MSRGRPFRRMFRDGGSPKPGSWAAADDALDELFPPVDRTKPEETTNQETP